MQHNDGLYGVSVAMFDVPVVATACADSNVYLWRGFDATQPNTMQGHKGEVCAGIYVMIMIDKLSNEVVMIHVV
jgi:hypothetical protein